MGGVGIGIVQWDLNSELVWYSDHEGSFDPQMVPYSDADYHGSLLLRSNKEMGFLIQDPS